VQSRITWRGSKLFKQVLQIIVISAAILVSITRITDYAHHWSDVLAGALMGTVTSLFIGILATDLFKTKSVTYIP
jgi:phosphatidate phosphatase